MDNARFLLAIVLAIGVIVLTNLLFPPVPAPEAPAPDAATQDTAAPGPAAGRGPDTAAEPRRDTFAEPEPVAPAGGLTQAPDAAPAIVADTILVRSPLYEYGISTAGGGVVQARLLRFESFAQEGAVDLVPRGVRALIRYELELGDRTVDLSTLPFQTAPAQGFALDAGDDARTLSLVHRDPGSGAEIRITYAFAPDHYLIGVSGEVVGRFAEPPVLNVVFSPALAIHEADPAEDRRAAAYVVNGRREGIRSVQLTDVERQRIEEGPLFWAGLRSKYFVAAAISPCEAVVDCFGGAIVEPAPAQEFGVEMTATLPVDRDGGFAYSLYLGPQETERLAQIGRDLQDVNPYGWRVFRPILRPLAHLITWAVVGMHEALSLGYGWVLILFGILVRLVLWPLNSKAMRSQLKNMELQPVIQDIQKRYKNEPEKLQKEMLRLYKEEGFNPLGGCLPMLIPFPVLITLYFVFQNTIEFRGVEFLWLPDLSRPDPLYILPILLGASMFALQWLSARSQTNINPQMKIMMWVMPGMITLFFFNLASGLNLYYAASNLASIPQQIQIMQERKRAQEKLASS